MRHDAGLTPSPSWSQRAGLIHRLGRVFADDGRAFLIAADHRQRGIQEGMQDFQNFTSAIVQALRHADALVATKEPIRDLITSAPREIRGKGMVLSLNRTGLSGSVFEWDDRCVTAITTAVRWGLEGAKFLVRIGPDKAETSAQLQLCGEICDRCEEWDMPLILEPLYCTEKGGRLAIDTSPDKVGYAAIVAGDFSVPAIKIPYPDGSSRSARAKSFRDVVGSVNSRVLVLGGARMPLTKLLEIAEDSLAEGGSGMVVGRNVLLDGRPGSVAGALVRVIHQSRGSKEAYAESTKEAG